MCAREGGREEVKEGRRGGEKGQKERKRGRAKVKGEPERRRLNVCVGVFNVCVGVLNVCCNCKRERPRAETKGDQSARGVF